MNRPMVYIKNALTGEEITREMNDVEFAQYQIDIENEVKQKAQEEQKQRTRQALFDRLGITAEEAQLLLGGNS